MDSIMTLTCVKCGCDHFPCGCFTLTDYWNDVLPELNEEFPLTEADLIPINGDMACPHCGGIDYPCPCGADDADADTVQQWEADEWNRMSDLLFATPFN